VTILKSYLSLYILMSQRTTYGSGPLELGFQGYVLDSTNGFVQACSEAANIPIVHDLNFGNGVGIKHGTATLNSALRRSSSYDGFYKQARHRTNLRVLHDAPVTGIAFSEPSANITGYNSTTALPRAIGVSYIEQSVGFVGQAKARKEVIISMGAF
jgi:choline dehydrogenase